MQENAHIQVKYKFSAWATALSYHCQVHLRSDIELISGATAPLSCTYDASPAGGAVHQAAAWLTTSLTSWWGRRKLLCNRGHDSYSGRMKQGSNFGAKKKECKLKKKKTTFLVILYYICKEKATAHVSQSWFDILVPFLLPIKSRQRGGTGGKRAHSVTVLWHLKTLVT